MIVCFNIYMDKKETFDFLNFFGLPTFRVVSTGSLDLVGIEQTILGFQKVLESVGADVHYSRDFLLNINTEYLGSYLRDPKANILLMSANFLDDEGRYIPCGKVHFIPISSGLAPQISYHGFLSGKTNIIKPTDEEKVKSTISRVMNDFAWPGGHFPNSDLDKQILYNAHMYEYPKYTFPAQFKKNIEEIFTNEL
jgi:hypothetical protein